jgi:ATPase subunit of ABC transporter with duplicated ATPase domains
MMFARMMMARPNVLVLDEPTNHLDLESITAVNNGLINYPGTMLFTSQDREFVNSIATRIIELTPKGLIDKGPNSGGARPSGARAKGARRVARRGGGSA